MKHIFTITIGLLLIASCAQEETPIQQPDNTVIIEAVLPSDEIPASKVVLSEGASNTIDVNWAASGETFSLMTANSTSTETFTQFGPSSFKGEIPRDWSPDYYAFYPTTISKNAASVNYDIHSQKGTLGNNNPYMFAKSYGGIIYYFQHLTALVKLIINMPQDYDGTPSKITVSSNKLKATGSFDLTTTTPTIHGAGEIITLPAQTAAQSSYTTYVYMNPITASENDLTTFKIEIPDATARYSGTFSTSKSIVAGNVYDATITLEKEARMRLENPTELFVDQIDETSAWLYWNDVESREAKYFVYKKEPSVTHSAEVSADEEKYKFQNLTIYTPENSMIYKFGAQARSGDVNTIDHSEIVYSRPYKILNWEDLQEFNVDYWQDEPDTWTGEYRECIAPEGISVTANNNGSITMTWTCGSAAEVGFNLYARPVSETAWHKEHLKTFVEGQFAYNEKITGTISGLTSGTRYILAVQTKGTTGARNSNIIPFFNASSTGDAYGSVPAR